MGEVNIIYNEIIYIKIGNIIKEETLNGKLFQIGWIQ